MGKRNVTVALDEDILRWARIRAAERDTSVSQLLAEMIKRDQSANNLVADERYQQAMKEYFAIQPRRLRHRGERLPTRDEMHER